MSESSDAISFKALREYCKELGLTSVTIGMPVDEMIAQARKTENPRAWLAALSNAPPEDDEDSIREAHAEAAYTDPPAVAASIPSCDLVPHEPDPIPQSIPFTLIGSDLIAVVLPISREQPVGYLEREMRLDLRLGPAASIAFRRLWKALDQNNTRLKCGKHVGSSRADVVRWVFEQVADAIATKGGV